MATRTILLVLLSLCLHCCTCHPPCPLNSLRRDRATTSIDDAVTITISPSKLERPGADWVNVTWSGVQSPQHGDWIGVYSPPVNGSTIDHSLHAPVKYQYADFTSTHAQSGAGLLKFRLVNMRADVIVGFFTGGFEKPTLVAVSNVVSFANPNEPLQGHLSYTGDPSKMILTWVSGQAGSPKVMWWPAGGAAAPNVKAANTSTYSAKDMCGSPATDFGYRDPGMLHHVTMDKLSPEQHYQYKFGDDTSGGSQVYSFKAPPMPSPSATVKFIAYGDMGNGQEDDSRQVVTGQQPSLNTTRRVEGEPSVDVVMHIGDISYARGYASVWDEFFEQIQGIATSAPYMVCIGNHERDFPNSGSYYTGTDSGGECGVPYERRFPMPRPSLDDAWYGFDYGSAHVVLMSTEHDFRPQSAQYKFLDQHLAGVDRKVTPWLVFAGHRPMYVDSTNADGTAGDQPVASELQTNVEPLLNKYKVDLALWGHHHSYQRTCPLYKGECNDEEGIPHVVIGMAGQSLSQNLKPLTPSWIKMVDDHHFGYSRFVANSTTLFFEYVRNDGTIPDSFYLKVKA